MPLLLRLTPRKFPCILEFHVAVQSILQSYLYQTSPVRFLGLPRLPGEVPPVVRRIRGVHDSHNCHYLHPSPFGQLPLNTDAGQLDFLHPGEPVALCTQHSKYWGRAHYVTVSKISMEAILACHPAWSVYRITGLGGNWIRVNCDTFAQAPFSSC